MNLAAAPPPSLATRVLLFVVGTVLFTAVYCQAPLFYSNQNQYFLHGLAEAGWGNLPADWLANTADPTPAFSALVAFVARRLPLVTFQVIHALLLGVYGASMLTLFVFLARPGEAGRRWPVFVALFITCHCAALRWGSNRLFGFDYPWFFQAGVAGQYVLGAMLQPSVFGVLLVAAVALHASGRPWLAALAVGLGADLHATYLLPGAMLTLGFMAGLLLERRWRTALGTGALTLALVLPVVVDALVRFGPTSPEMFTEAQRILAHVRIPHHTQPRLWLDPIAGLQIAWVALSLFLVRGTRLLPALAVPFALSVVLTLTQVVTGSDTLALLFPWRVSAVLVPLATTVILSRLALLPAFPFGGRVAWISATAVILAAVGVGGWITASRQAFRMGDGELALMDEVRRHASPGDVYLLPVKVPKLATTTRGSLSSDFKPLAEKTRDGRVIPPTLQRFRLHARAAIYVDFKSIPYKDADVLEWLARLRTAESVYARITAGQPVVEDLLRLGITHVVVPASSPPPGEGAKATYADDSYRIFRIGEK